MNGELAPVVTGGGEVTDEEMAAISAAASVLVFGPRVGAPAVDPVPRWRFSGRWWVKPVPLRRHRP